MEEDLWEKLIHDFKEKRPRNVVEAQASILLTVSQRYTKMIDQLQAMVNTAQTMDQETFYSAQVRILLKEAENLNEAVGLLPSFSPPVNFKTAAEG